MMSKAGALLWQELLAVRSSHRTGLSRERALIMSSQRTSGPPTITVTVHVPSDPTPREFTWPKTMKVGDAADEAAAAFGISESAEAPTFQIASGAVLDRQKPLVAEGVEAGAVLDLVSAGGGV